MDLHALRKSLAQLRRGDLLMIAQRALDLVPAAAVPALLGGLVEVPASSEVPLATLTLLEEVQRFHAQSMQGRFYDDVSVGPRNADEQSRGTDAFIAEFLRLIASCVDAAQTNPCLATAQAFELLLALLQYIDLGNDDVIFFADEGGSWSVGVAWSQALPAYFNCLTNSASPERFAQSVDRQITCFVERDRPRYLGYAMAVATPEQRLALSKVGASAN